MRDSSTVALLLWLRNTLNDLLALILERHTPRRILFRFVAFNPTQFFPEGTTMLLLTDEQMAVGSIRPVTAAGNPASVDGVPAWSSSNPEIVAVAQAPDGMSAIVSAVGPLGTAQIQVTVDADLGEGVREISAVATVEVKAAEAVAVNIEFGEPELKG